MPIRLINHVVQFRRGEAITGWLMFVFSFLAMMSHNIIRPITKSKVIAQFGSENVPYIQLAAGLLIGVLMYAHSRASARLPRRAIIPVTQAGLIGISLTFWILFKTGAAWVPVAFYVYGMLFGILLISQFWTLANDIYDPRQARRLFGFIGGGASLGGAAGASVTAFAVDNIGTNNLVLASAITLAACTAIVILIIRRQPDSINFAVIAEERGVGATEAIRLFSSSKHLQIISLVIGCAAIGGVIIDQQLNMAADANKTTEDAITGFLAQVTVWLSLISFVVQVGLTSRIHRSLGLTFALLLLPVSLGSSAILILVTGALWAPAVARILDTSLRYTIDKTSREVLFLPLSPELKQRAKPFIDVTVDRIAKAMAAMSLIVLIQPWGLGLDWQRLSYASLTIMALWVVLAIFARRQYLRSFRESLGTREMAPETLRLDVADPATVEALVGELSHPDERAVLYAIDMLETLDKRHLISPLLLHHESAKVRARALVALEAAPTARAAHWLPAVQRMLRDTDADVRAAAVRALAAVRKEDASAVMRSYLDDAEPRVVVTAAVALADSGRPDGEHAAEAAMARLIADTRAAGIVGRREAADALAHVKNPKFRTLLISLIHDSDAGVAAEAIASARLIGPSDMIFVPALVARLGHRELKRVARETLISYGEDVVPVLAFFLADRDEQIWVRRHLPATLAQIPVQRSMDVLVGALDDPDGFLRYKLIEAIESLRRDHPNLTFDESALESLVLNETSRYCTYLTLRDNLERHDARTPRSLLARALDDKLERTLDRVYRLLCVIYPWKDVVAARYSLDHGDAHTRASALEYLDTLLAGPIRRRVMPLIDEQPLADKVQHANSVLKTRPRDLDDTLAQLVHEEDPVVAASAIDLVRERARWNALTDDLQYIVGRATAPPLVLEAAAWALAHAPGAAVVAPPNSHLPVVRVADRLRTIPVFGFVSIDELFRVASVARQLRLDPGRTIPGDVAAEDVYFLVDGQVRVASAGQSGAVIAAPATVGFEDMLEGRRRQQTIASEAGAIAMAVSTSECLTMLSDNIAMARGVFRMLLADAASSAALGRWENTTAEPDAPSRPLESVEKALRLRQNRFLGQASVEQLLDLVAVARDVPLMPGQTLVNERDAAAVFHILRGEVAVTMDDGAAWTLGSGSTIGLAETLAGTAPHRRVTVTREGHALKVDREALYGVLADHIDLLQGVFSGVLGAVPRR
ncbi:MAG TPA: HEAT repeat domain-containing protein [Vicinamibacterales bacterium]|nr:HEAT repeat domain-containing protein [Vicinamibacterales bacterium]